PGSRRKTTQRNREQQRKCTTPFASQDAETTVARLATEPRPQWRQTRLPRGIPMFEIHAREVTTSAMRAYAAPFQDRETAPTFAVARSRTMARQSANAHNNCTR